MVALLFFILFRLTSIQSSLTVLIKFRHLGKQKAARTNRSEWVTHKHPTKGNMFLWRHIPSAVRIDNKYDTLLMFRIEWIRLYEFKVISTNAVVRLMANQMGPFENNQINVIWVLFVFWSVALSLEDFFFFHIFIKYIVLYLVWKDAKGSIVLISQMTPRHHETTQVPLFLIH